MYIIIRDIENRIEIRTNRYQFVQGKTQYCNLIMVNQRLQYSESSLEITIVILKLHYNFETTIVVFHNNFQYSVPWAT